MRLHHWRWHPWFQIGSMKIRRKKHPSCKNPSPQPLKDLGSTYQLWSTLIPFDSTYSVRKQATPLGLSKNNGPERFPRHFRAFCFICRSLIIQNLPSSGSPRWITTTPWPWGSPTTTWPGAAGNESMLSLWTHPLLVLEQNLHISISMSLCQCIISLLNSYVHISTYWNI